MALVTVASECPRTVIFFSLWYLSKGISMLLCYYGFVKEQTYEGIMTHLYTHRKSVVAEDILIFIIIQPVC